jgi:predicted Zn-ribbon and HTH transcriptional regulator
MVKTIRKEMIALLSTGEWTALDLSQAIHITEKEVYHHLEHVIRSLRGNLGIKPPSCLGCGFTFTKRKAVRAPSRCPLCKSERIKEPLYFSTGPEIKKTKTSEDRSQKEKAGVVE